MQDGILHDHQEDDQGHHGETKARDSGRVKLLHQMFFGLRMGLLTTGSPKELLEFGILLGHRKVRLWVDDEGKIWTPRQQGSRSARGLTYRLATGG